jgi:acetyl esterase/lipase
MTERPTDATLRVPERTIPVPQHLSPQAREFLSVVRPASLEYPSLTDTAGWKCHVAATEAMVMRSYLAGQQHAPCEIRELYEGAALAYELTPAGVTAADRRVYLDIHGGALYIGSGEICKAMALATATRHGARVVAVDYRMPPDYPYPAGLEDCLGVYRALLRDHRPQEIIVGGGSAGGNLAAAMLLRARDEGLPLPAGAVLLSPEVDLTESGDTFRTNAGIDGMSSLMAVNLLYAGGADLADPYVSPLFGDFDKGFPPTLLTAGTRDVFLSNAVRMHRALRAAGVPAELHILEAAPHGGFAHRSPEEAALDHDIRGFCDARWAGR